MDDLSVATERHYNALAEHWQQISDGPGKEHILRPALEPLLPAVDDITVLDAGCGDGSYAATLADRGATVVGVDASTNMIEVARERHGDVAKFHCADLAAPLDQFESNTFDLVLCQHVFSHLHSLETPVDSFARVLRPGGTLVVSTHHPFHDYLVVREESYPDTADALDMDLDPAVDTPADAPQYLDTEQFTIDWAGGDSDAPGTYVRRPMTGLLQPLLAAGFRLAEIVEPEPDDEFTAEFPELAAELETRPPRSVCLKAVLPE